MGSLNTFHPTAIRTVDLRQPLQNIDDVTDYAKVRVYASLNGSLLGFVDIINHYQPIGAARLREALVDGLHWTLLDKVIARQYLHIDAASATLPTEVSASVVVATRDRPDDLRACLRSLTAQASPRRVEIVVVDNNPSSGLTPAVVAEFPSATLVHETRQGLSYARNKGISSSTGDVIVFTDDDVTMPPDWLEKLLSPFAHPEVMAVTGNVLPRELDTPAQLLFEAYGGLGRGLTPIRADRAWFDRFRVRAVPTWLLGATANAAFRAELFADPRIGLLDEALGLGTPTGCGEDTYLFYKILKAGYSLVYEPNAYVWHRHRRDMKALRRQIYNYSKGHVAYHLTTLLRDHDLRAAAQLALGLPRAHVWKIKERLRGRSPYPLSLILLELIGNLIGPVALWRSRRRVKREGRSDPYTLFARRSTSL